MTTHNPYVHAQSGNPISGSMSVPGLGYTSKGALVASSEPAVNNQGLINAHDDRQALAIIANLMDQRSKQSIVQASSQTRIQAQARLQAAFQDKRNPEFAIAGETVTNTIRDTAARAGFLRRFLPERDLTVGEDPKIRLRKNETNAFSLHEMSVIDESRHDGRFAYPPEVMIGARPTITEADLYKEGFGLLEEKADEGLEIIMVTEDRALKGLSDAAVRATNQQLAFTTFTPSVFATLKQYVQNTGGLPVAGAWMANDLWVDVNTGNSAFSDCFSMGEK